MGSVLIGVDEGVPVSGHTWFGSLCEGYCDLFDVLRCGCHQALACDADETSEAGITVPVKLFGIGKGALDRLLSPLVDRLAPGRLAVGVGARFD